MTDTALERARRVMRRIATAARAGTGTGVAPLPPEDAPPLRDTKAA